ncbi:putative n5-carboxyaminoimidazole ribonucleotide synthase [Mycobacterium kansasii]|uniref:Putative n5-carboxyaminoimidazole ribonucleotide synthase n=1 Tax=Mycobacterium kansasii TaxID=1768 RepID=A0A1V3XT82_MYCKA|nr:putative n5-carboxyaminoimidazole ribonucleotide synthase [Mycobacterium kansasii]
MAAQVTPNVVIGSHTDIDDLRRVAAGAHVLTFDHEHVPTELLEKLVAEGVNVAPPPQALVHAQDKLVMRQKFGALGPGACASHRHREARRPHCLDAFARAGDAPLVVQGRSRRLRRPGACAWRATSRCPPTSRATYLTNGVACWSRSGWRCARNSPALVARVAVRPGRGLAVVQTVQRDGICVQVIAPAPELTGDSPRPRSSCVAAGRRTGCGGGARRRALRDDRRHAAGQRTCDAAANSGHWPWTGLGPVSSSSNLRAVLDYPLGDTDAIVPVTVMANVLGAAAPPAMSLDERLHHLFARMPEAKVHLYGKAERPAARWDTSTSSAPKVLTCNSCGTAPSLPRIGCHMHSGPTDGIPMPPRRCTGRTPTQAGGTPSRVGGRKRCGGATDGIRMTEQPGSR